MNLHRLQASFQSPPSLYRGKPFWAWNGRLEPDELRRQIRIMHKMGLGGFFMHSRVGLDTAYLSPDWFRCVRACVDEAKKLKMEAWLYDEDRWPSGAAGGLVTKNPRYRMRRLVMRELHNSAKFRWRKETLAAFAAQVKGTTVTSFRPIARGSPVRLARGETLLDFQVVTEPVSAWFNDATYLNTLSRDAVREFIRVTHEAYRKEIGKDFGRLVPGIFTDEPHHGGMCEAWSPDGDSWVTTWTEELPSAFRQRYGYDLLPHLPELFYDRPDRSVIQVRYHYHDCTTHLFVDAFARQVGEWCGRNGIAFTGHVLTEDTLSSQTHLVGACMRFYEHMQRPGMDLLTEHWRIWETAKQLSSAAHQFGQKWRLTETYGCTGWDFPFAGHKTLGDWQVALGVNLRCQHLSWYTMEGEAKRDYPAGIFYQSPWWEAYPRVEDYFARVHAIMTRGEEVRDLLVIHPVESMWTMVRKKWNQEMDAAHYDRMLVDLRDSLLAAHIDFDYGDEELLSRHGKVVTQDGRPALKMGKALYRAVIVPPLITMRATTLDLLRRFLLAGGRVVFAGEPARCLDAKPSTEIAQLARFCCRAPAKGPELAKTVDPLCRRLSIADSHGKEVTPAIYLLREDAEAFYLFVCNTGHNFLAEGKMGAMKDIPVRQRTLAFPDVRIRGFAGCKGAPVEMDPNTGEVFTAEAAARKDDWEIHTSLPALGSRLFVIPKAGSTKGIARRSNLRLRRIQPLGGSSWDIVLSENNNLVLDRARYRIGNQPWQKADEILRVDQAARDALGVRHRGGAMVQPWARKPAKHARSIPVILEYSFEVDALPSGSLFLAIEQPKTFRIEMNGVALDTDMECGWWTDRSLRKIPLKPSILRCGANTITLTCDYRESHPGFEIIYLLGNFGVKLKGNEPRITVPPAALKLGDWVPQGLTFYSGSVSYRKTIRPRLRAGERLFVQVPEYRGVGVRVLVDGQSAGIIAWEPNEIDITDLAKKPVVDLQIEILGHRRNSHGPFHYVEKWPEWTGPGQYVARGKEWVDQYQLVPCGLMQPPRLAVKR
jgi:hypothetical protein